MLDIGHDGDGDGRKSGAAPRNLTKLYVIWLVIEALCCVVCGGTCDNQVLRRVIWPRAICFISFLFASNETSSLSHHFPQSTSTWRPAR